MTSQQEKDAAIAELTSIVAEAVDAERDAIVAWLVELKVGAAYRMASQELYMLDRILRRIANNEHRKATREQAS
jgi:hypothetical protein